MMVMNTMKDIYANRTLLYSMIIRNLKGKYKNSYLGFAWHFVTPAIMILMFYILYTGIMQQNVENYWVYLCTGMFPFYFLQGCLINGSNCIVSNAGTIKKMYFPREIIILSDVASAFITFLIGYAVVITLMLITNCSFNGFALLFLPVIMIITAMFAIGYELILSTIVVFVRDLQYLIQALSRILFWVTPVFYVIDNMKGILSTVVGYNPFTYFIEIYHEILYDGNIPNTHYIMLCIIFAVFALIIGVFVFNRFKGRFAEEL